jgi:hypothetical protein
MKHFCAFGLLLALSGELYSQSQTAAKPSIPELIIGRDSYFDFGPPFHYFEVIRVRSASAGTEVRRALLTPAADTCLQTAKAEFSEGSMHESIPDLLNGVDLCALSEKLTTNELKRRNKGLVFSGANVALRVRCPAGIRVLPSAILDRDIYGGRSTTPQFTSFTMQLLSKLDRALGPGVMEKPILPQLAKDSSQDQNYSDGEFERELKDGRYDALFPGTADRVSGIFAASLVPAPSPEAKLLRSEPFEPDTFPMPVYPPIAKAAHVEGDVSFHLEVGSGCAPEEITIDDGPKLLRDAVENSVKDWKFCQVPEGQEIQATIAFRLNCPVK